MGTLFALLVSMRLPVQLTFRNMEPSDAVASRIQTLASDLDRFYDRIMSVRVAFEQRHRHHHKGSLFHVRIELVVPGKELVVSSEGHDEHAHEDPYVAIRDAFDAARRQLQDFARQRRGYEKTHAVPDHGHIIELSPDGYGFIETIAGQRVYFHKNAVANGQFERLAKGAEVRFELHPDESGKGPQASAVHLVGKHHLAPTDTV
jgi:cold shock CspA family protein/ribosome-associated translation inhibitor RaiA